jgi:3-isopropylmalate/(R)-2-methylmalate dehydratase small subunit
MPKMKFEIFESTCIPLPFENVDTDQIIPARFLSATSREGFGDNLFRDWRYTKTGEKNTEFVLNNPKFAGKVLVAVWAIYDYGFRAVVSSFFADIFTNNSLNNGLLPIVISEVVLKKLLDMIQKDPSVKVIIDLEKQLFTIVPTGDSVSFAINPYKKECMLKGLDDIDFLLSMKNVITSFETNKTW